jgi:hypothetical protein
MVRALVKPARNVDGAADINLLTGSDGAVKTTLAIAIANDERIRQTFHAGVLWLDAGGNSTPASLVEQALAVLAILNAAV